MQKNHKDKMMKYRGDAGGVVVDGTGGSIKAMEKLVNEFKEKGYDVSMLFVETSLETALARNRNRKGEENIKEVVLTASGSSVFKSLANNKLKPKEIAVEIIAVKQKSSINLLELSFFVFEKHEKHCFFVFVFET